MIVGARQINFARGGRPNLSYWVLGQLSLIKPEPSLRSGDEGEDLGTRPLRAQRRGGGCKTQGIRFFKNACSDVFTVREEHEHE